MLADMKDSQSRLVSAVLRFPPREGWESGHRPQGSSAVAVRGPSETSRSCNLGKNEHSHCVRTQKGLDKRQKAVLKLLLLFVHT